MNQITLIRVTYTATGETIGHVTPDEFRSWMGVRHAFIDELVKRYNAANHGQTVTHILACEKK